jgi:hypothetical protein
VSGLIPKNWLSFTEKRKIIRLRNWINLDLPGTCAAFLTNQGNSAADEWVYCIFDVEKYSFTDKGLDPVTLYLQAELMSLPKFPGA